MAQSIQVCAIRVTRLNALGEPITGAGATNGFVAKAPISVNITPDREAGVELSAANGCGTLCGYYKQEDQLKKYDISFELCDFDFELIELLTDEPIVTVGGETVGQTALRVATCNPTTRNGVAVEFWTKRWEGCGPPVGAQYFHWFYPRLFLQTGDKTQENDFMSVPIEGYAQENPYFNYGGWTEGAWPAGAGPLEALYGVVQDTYIPDPSDGYIAVS